MAKIFICGDIINYKQGNDSFVGEDLIKEVNKADYAICNFEGPEIKVGESVNFPHQEPGTAAYLKNIGFDLMLLANNHITEQGYDGVKYTIEAISDTGAKSIGAGLSWNETYHPLVQEIDGLIFGFINICEAQVGQFLTTEQSFGYAWMGYDNLFIDIEKLSKKTDYVIVLVHAGLEHYSIPLPEIRSFYNRLCGAGAAVVVGGHTHTAQGFEYKNEKLIIYSLGNFYFPHDNGKRIQENTSYSICLNFNKGKNIELTPIHHHYENGKVELIKEKSEQTDVDYLCTLLSQDYENRANEMCIDAYMNLCSNLLSSAICGESEKTNFKESLKNAIRFTVFRKKYVIKNKKSRRRLLLRLFENESYRYTIIRALKHININTNI